MSPTTQNQNQQQYLPPGYDPNDPSTWAMADNEYLDTNAEGQSAAMYANTQPPVSVPGPTSPPGGAYAQGIDMSSGWNSGWTGDTYSPGEMLGTNRTSIESVGNALMGNAGAAANYYGNLQEGYRQAADTAYGNLAANPGYNPALSGEINADYSQYNTSPDAMNQRFLTSGEQAGMAGNPNAPFNYYNPQEPANIAAAQYNEMANTAAQENQWLSGNIDKGALTQSQGVGQAAQGYVTSGQQGAGGAISGGQAAAGGAISGAAGGIASGLGTEASSISGAVNNQNLLLDPSFAPKYEMSDQDVQDLANQGARAVGTKYQALEDQLRQNAAAEGNTSPLAIAAAEKDLAHQQGVQSADAETDALIAAKQAQAGRLQTAESMRLGAQQQQSGMQLQGAEGLGAQDIASQEYLGGLGVGSAEAFSGQGVGAAENFAGLGANTSLGAEQQRLGAQQYLTNTEENAASTAGNQYMNAIAQGRGAQTQASEYGQTLGTGLAQTADEQAAARAAAIAQNRQNTLTGNQNTQYSQGIGSQQLTSQGAQTVGNAQIAGQGAYRSYLTGEQGAGQTGYQTAAGQQLQGYGIQSGGINQAAASQVTNNNSMSPGQSMGMGIFGTLFADGGVVDEPTEATLGENGPEAVVPLGNQDDGGQDGPTVPLGKTDLSGNYLLPPTWSESAVAQPAPSGGSGGGGKGSGGGFVGSLLALYEDGGVVTRPTPAIVAEHGPEQIVPVGQYNTQGGSMGPINPAMRRYGVAQNNGGGFVNKMLPQRQQAMGMPPQQRPQAPVVNALQGRNPLQGTNAGAVAGGMRNMMQRPQPPMGAAGGAMQPVQPSPMGQSSDAGGGAAMPRPQIPPPGPGGAAMPPQLSSRPQMGGGGGWGQPGGVSAAEGASMGGGDQQMPNYLDNDQRMATGGVITKPTRVVLGDRGPEAVVPLRPGARAKLTPGMMPKTPGLPMASAGMGMPRMRTYR